MAPFGHAAADYAVALAKRAGARQVVLFHHQPDRTDDELDQLAQRFATSPVPVIVAAEGTSLTCEGPGGTDRRAAACR